MYFLNIPICIFNDDDFNYYNYFKLNHEFTAIIGPVFIVLEHEGLI